MSWGSQARTASRFERSRSPSAARMSPSRPSSCLSQAIVRAIGPASPVSCVVSAVCLTNCLNRCRVSELMRTSARVL